MRTSLDRNLWTKSIKKKKKITSKQDRKWLIRSCASKNIHDITFRISLFTVSLLAKLKRKTQKNKNSVKNIIREKWRLVATQAICQKSSGSEHCVIENAFNVGRRLLPVKNLWDAIYHNDRVNHLGIIRGVFTQHRLTNSSRIQKQKNPIQNS